ncbi:hypothetical protein [Massilia yuzhufengensis]|uniref:Lipoprotein n=1 Tax=Massilia yuzhufengensis TaxID=1164594 RepID=A0A1I1PB99_9BURK|nr:hypothetical protein [Massilia yuzhufengensis]SFD06872.1 hypothetical protein SAMN05216204_11573 [Massilia yuzhufengensis]
MNFSSLHTITIITISALLAACGAGSQDVQGPMRLELTVHVSVAVAAAGTNSSAASLATSPAFAAAPGRNNPAPDCAADGCAGLRIIDGNAEAFRVDAMRRAATTEQS